MSHRLFSIKETRESRRESKEDEDGKVRFSVHDAPDQIVSNISWVDSNPEPADSIENLRIQVIKEKDKEEHTDETIRIFSAMPKGLEYFMSMGTQATIRMKQDEKKILIDEEMMTSELKWRRNRLHERCHFMVEKKEMLLQDFAKFEEFVLENQKKLEKGKHNFLQTVIKNVELQFKKLKMISELHADQLLMKRLERHFNQYQPLADLVTNTCTVARITNFEMFMFRHNSLVNTVEYLKREQELNLTERQEKLDEEMANQTSAHTKDILMLRQQIINKSMRLKQVKKENQKLKEMAEAELEKKKASMQNEFLIERGIRNMAKALYNYRNFTEHRMTPAMESDDIKDMLDAVGNIILDYKTILGSVKKRANEDSTA